MPLVALVVWLLVAVGCRSVDVSEPSEGGGESDLAAEAPESTPSDTVLADAVTVTTVLPELADESEDEPPRSVKAVDSLYVPDGTRWEPPVLPLCRELVFPEGAVAEPVLVGTRWDADPPSIEFDGWSVSAMHAPDPNWAHSAIDAVISAERADSRAFEDQFLFVTVTSESGTERTHRLPLSPPWEVHPSLHTAADAGRMVADEAGWIVPVGVITFMDSRLLVSEYFAEHAPGVVTVRAHYDEEGQISGLRIIFGNGSGYDGSDYAGECLASWEELGTTEDLFDQYGAFVDFNKPYTAVSQESGYLWVSRWGGEPVQVELPDQWGRCCSIQVLDDGYVAFSSTVQAGVSNWPHGQDRLHYSKDGLEWRKVDLPTSKFTYDYDTNSPDTEWIDIPIDVCSVKSTDSGVLIAQDLGRPYDGSLWCDTVRHWIADADLTNWRLHPDAPAWQLHPDAPADD